MALRLARTFAYSVVYLVLTISQFANAAAEFLPQGSSQDELQHQAQMIQSILPWSRHNNADYLILQNSSLNELRRRFPDYNKWAAEKPDPITIDIQTKSQSNKMSLVLNDEQFSILKKQAFGELFDLISQNPKASLEDLKTLVIQKIGQSLLSGADSVRGLITGILQVLPADKRGALFKAGEPAVQLQMLRDLKLTDEILRSGAFQGERFGLDSKTMTVKQVFALIESKLDVHQNFLAQLGILQILNRTKPDDLNKLAKNPEKLLLASDFGFVDNGDNTFITGLEAQLQKQFPKMEGKIGKALSQAVGAVPKQWFERKNTPVEVLTPYVKVVEVHPYLAVYRGCIGGDCSTSNSPMYPYSPWEHVYYIVLPDGTFVGYISATRIQAGGKTTLYLKDISGRTLSPDMVEVILHAFGRVYPYYNVKQFSLASYAFTDRENHFPNLQAVLAKYNGRPAVSRPVVSENTVFPDEPIRAYIQATQLFASGSGYDAVNRHTTAVVFEPQLDMSSYSVSYKTGTLSPFKPKTPRDSLVFALRMLAADEKADLSKIPGLDETEVRGVVNNLKNPNQLTLDAYYKEVGYVFRNYGIELSRGFRQDFENFFIEGHLNAYDAFTTNDATLRGDSERFFVTYCRRFKDLDFIALVLSVATKQKVLAQSKRVSDLIELLQSRAEPADIAMLSVFAWGGLDEAKKAFTKGKVKADVEDVVYEYVFNRKMPFLQNGIYPPLVLMNYMAKNQAQYNYDQMNRSFSQTLAIMGLQLGHLQNERLVDSMDRLLLSTNGAFQDANALARYVALFEEGKIPDLEFATRVLREWKQIGSTAGFQKIFSKLLDRLLIRDSSDVKSALLFVAFRAVTGGKSKNDLHFSPAMIQLFDEYSKTRTILGGDFLELVRIFAEAGLGNVNMSIIGEMKKLEVALRSEDTFGQKVANPGQLIATSAQALGIDIEEFNRDPKVKKLIESQLLKSVDSFQNPKVRRRAFEMLAEAIVSNDSGSYEEGLKNLLASRDQLRGSEEIQAFSSGVAALARQGGNRAAFIVLSQLITNNLMNRDVEISTGVLKELVSTNDPYIQIYVAERILAKDPKAQFSVETLRRFASVLDNDDDKKIADEMLIYSEKALDILIKVRTQDEVVQKELRKTVKEEDNLRMVLKAAIAYLKNGGDVEGMKKYVRRAIKDIKEVSSASEVRELRAEFKALAGDANEDELRSCKAFFRSF